MQTIAFSHQYAACVFSTVHEPLVVVDAELRVVQVGDAFSRRFEITPADIIGRSLLEMGGGRWNTPGLRDLLEVTLRGGSETHHAIVDGDFGGDARTLFVNARKFAEGGTTLVLLAIEDMTERRTRTSASRSVTVARAARGQAERTTAAEGGRCTILLVEDQDDVRQVAREILQRGGYDVIEAAHPSVALSIVRNDGAHFDLLLTDIVMPEMSGRDLVRTLTPLLPDLKVLYTSGYAENEIVDHGALDAGVPFVAKPFTPHALLRAVRATLDGTPVA